MKIKVAIADDHIMVINGIRTMLADCADIEITQSYTSGDALLQGLTEHVPDVLLLDIQMPDKTGDKLAPVILKTYPEIRILTLTNFDSAFYARNMLAHGALGYLLKSTEEETLIRAIKTVYEYQEFLEPSIQAQISEKQSKTNRTAVEQPLLTPREQQVIQLIVDGCTSREIGEKLHIGAETVKNYRFTLLLKLGAKNTAMLVKKAVQTGLVK